MSEMPECTAKVARWVDFEHEELGRVHGQVLKVKDGLSHVMLHSPTTKWDSLGHRYAAGIIIGVVVPDE